MLANSIALIILGLGLVFQNDIVTAIGLFAFSGAVTNSLAIHMLFEKVPYLYGSGVIQNKFEAFKNSIHTMIMEQFFTKENLQKFLKMNLIKRINTLTLKD